MFIFSLNVEKEVSYYDELKSPFTAAAIRNFRFTAASIGNFRFLSFISDRSVILTV
jgi:hypothetical protein